NQMNQILYGLFVEINIGNGGKKSLDQKPIGPLCGQSLVRGSPGQTDEGAGQLILEGSCRGGLSADARFSGAAGTSGSLLALKTKHLSFHIDFSSFMLAECQR